MRGGTLALGLARLRRDGALGERGGSGNRETVTSRAKTAWGGNGNSGDKEINGDAEISGCLFGWEHWRGAWSLSGKDELPSGRALQGLLEYPDQVEGKGCTVGAQRGNLA